MPTTATRKYLGQYISYDAQGYQMDSDVRVAYDPGDQSTVATYEVGRTLHRAEDIAVSDEGQRVEHVNGWYLLRKD